MGFDTARPEYYAGLKLFQENTNQQEQLQILIQAFLRNFKKELNLSLCSDSITPELVEQLSKFTAENINWLDLGSGDGGPLADETQHPEQLRISKYLVWRFVS